jgi:branched-chain amino acid transport system permease protein
MGGLRSNLASELLWLPPAVVSALLPLILSRYAVFVITLAMIFSIFAMSYNLLQGYLGAISFGHAAFLGLGAYVVAIYITRIGSSIGVAFLLTVVISGLAGLLIGAVSLRRYGLYFAMLTLAFAQLLYEAADKMTWLTNGVNGIPNVFAPPIPIFGYVLNFADPVQFYFVVLLALILTYNIIRKIVRTHFGLVLRAIRENEFRAYTVGFDVQRYKLVTFAITGLFGGVAGFLLALLQNVIGPGTLYYTNSGAVIFMALIGGTNSLFGPLVGAFTWIILNNVVSSVTTSWQIVLGIVFIAMIMITPEGLISTLQRRLKL